MTSPNAIRAQYPDTSYFFAGHAIHNFGLLIEDPALYSAAFQTHALNVASAHGLSEARQVVATLLFDAAGTCRDAFYLGKLNESWTPQLKERFVGHPRFSFDPHGAAAMAWVADPKGHSYFGGTAPDTFVYPPRRHPLNYQYLGFLSNEDLPQPVVGDGLHLIYPMLHYDDPIKVFDISDPLAPKPLTMKDFRWINDAKISTQYVSDGANAGLYEGYAEYNDGDTLVYERKQVSRKPSDFSTYPFMSASHPNWIHSPEIPICPRTGEAMTFAGQIGDGTPAIDNDFIRRVAQSGGSTAASILSFQAIETTFGHFVFYHPKGQTMCILTQN